MTLAADDGASSCENGALGWSYYHRSEVYFCRKSRAVGEVFSNRDALVLGPAGAESLGWWVQEVAAVLLE